MRTFVRERSSPRQPHLGFVVFEHSFGSGATGVVCHIEDDDALYLPADEGTIRRSLHHGQEVLVTVVTRGHHREGGPVVLFQHLKDDLQLEGGGAGELEVDGAALLKESWGRRSEGSKNPQAGAALTT